MEAVAREVFRAYNYHEIRTPIFEETQLFARGVGEETDIVSKEMYTFDDRDGTSLTLRPENTASVIRAYIEHRLDQQPGLQKLYYIGPDVPARASAEGPLPAVLSDRRGGDRLGIAGGRCRSDRDGGRDSARAPASKDFQLLINSVGCPNCRPAFIAELRERARRTSRRSCAATASGARRRIRCACSTARFRRTSRSSRRCRRFSIISATNAATHFEAVKQYLDDRGIAYEVRPRLVRGLDYYTRTTFEIVHGALGAQNSVLGGGRYDGLAEALGSKVPAPGIGFSIGEDRLVMTVEGSIAARRTPLDLFIAPLGDAALRHCGAAGARLARGGRQSSRWLRTRKLKRALEAGQQAGRAVRADRRRQRNRRRRVRAEEHGNRRADNVTPRTARTDRRKNRI